MSKAKHTPGPWQIERDGNGRPAAIGHKHILIASLSGPMPEGNAALIAAAPELLAALVRLLHETDNGTNICGQNIVDDARAAIAKATSAGKAVASHA